MKLLTYRRDENVSCGILTDRGVVDIPSSWKNANPPRSLKEILERGPSCLDQLRQTRRIRDADDPAGVGQAPGADPPAGQDPGPGRQLQRAHQGGLASITAIKLGLSDSPRQTTVPRPFLMPSTCVIDPGRDHRLARLQPSRSTTSWSWRSSSARTAKCVEAERRPELRRRLHHRQRRLRPQRDVLEEPPEAAVGRVLRLAQRQVGGRLLPDGALPRHDGRDRRRPEPQDGPEGQRRDPPERQHRRR